jgi:glyoxylase-like metal-dependent hydrolase (beta-lactamase superfamily II)
MVQIIPIRTRLANAYLLIGQRAVLVDSGSAHSADRIVAALKQAGLELSALSLIVQTHAHYDHCGSTAELKRLSSVPVAVHQSEQNELEHGKNAAVVPVDWMGYLTRPFVANQYEGVVADVLITDELDLRPYGVAASVIHTPGHTPGSVSVITDGGDAIAGDLLGGGWMYGLLLPERPRYHYFVADLAAVRSGIRRVLEYSPTRIYVGHGGPLETQAVVRWFARKIG